jgi:hypothetical protein
MLHIDGDQRRARLARRHRLVRPDPDPAGQIRKAVPKARSVAPGDEAVAAARSMVALHGTDPATVFLSIQARTSTVDIATIERALYQDRTLIRMLGMRRTMFVLPVEQAPMLHASCGQALAVELGRRYAQLMTEAGVGDAAFLAEVADAAAEALAKRGEATGAELSTDEPRLRTAVSLAQGKSYGATQNITSWVLMLLSAQGRIVRGRPKGSWISSQWRWSPVRSWLPDGLAEHPAELARAELVRQWLRAFGPGTVADLRWWTGWTAGLVKQALAAVGPVEVDLGGGETGLLLADDLEPVASPEPWVALLPALDPTPMGWSGRSWFLGEHAPALFDRSGNVGPTIWSDGRIVGGWARRADGQVACRLLSDIGSTATAAVDQAAARLADWIGPVAVTPRFRTPLERELSA